MVFDIEALCLDKLGKFRVPGSVLRHEVLEVTSKLLKGFFLGQLDGITLFAVYPLVAEFSLEKSPAYQTLANKCVSRVF